MRKTFMIPDIEEALGTNHNSDKIIVIAVLGKSAFTTKGSKIACIDHILPFDDKIHKNNEENYGLIESTLNRMCYRKSCMRKYYNCTGIYKKNIYESLPTIIKPFLLWHLFQCFIEGFYDEMNQIVYLHLNSMLDTNIFVEHYDKLTEKMASLGNSDDFLTVYDEIKSKFARALLLLFYISHLVILVHPNSTFDVNYVQYFKAADGLRQKLNSSFSNALKEVEGLSSETISAGRFCTPRLIFYFEREPKHVTNLKKTEHNMEDRIYHVLKKTRIITPSSYSLFAIPLNEEFVYISSGSRVNNLGHAVQGLIQSCQPRGSVNLQFPFCTESSSERDFTKFLKVHINQARSSGFEDNVTSSRQCQQQPFHFELDWLLRNVTHEFVFIGVKGQPQDALMAIAVTFIMELQPGRFCPCLCVHKDAQRSCLSVLNSKRTEWQSVCDSGKKLENEFIQREYIFNDIDHVIVRFDEDSDSCSDDSGDEL